MFPTLIEFPESWFLIGGQAIHTYGLLYALGFLAGLYWVRFESRRLGLDVEKVADLFFYIVIASVVGARLLYIFITVPEWWLDPLVFVRVWEGGLIFYGGFILAFLVGLFYCPRFGLNPLTQADIFMPGLALGHAIGRLGCFAAGCCYGKVAEGTAWYTFNFPQTKYGVAPHDQPLFATQLFEAFAEGLIFLILFCFRKKKKFEGEVFLLYIILYPVTRSIIEIFRGDKVRKFLIEDVLSTSQFISILWVTVAVILWTMVFRKQKA